MISNELLFDMLNDVAISINDNWEYLTDLDRAIGDGDHGINMNRGFRAVVEKIEKEKNKDCGTILKTVAMTLITTVGGAAGPLYGTAFLKASKAAEGKMELNDEDVVQMYDEAIKGIMARGKAILGEKTMLDALIPSYEALKQSLKEGADISQAFINACNAALQGAENTKRIKATKGRASYLGERSIGHIDPGAASSYLILKAISDTLNKRG